MLAVGRQLVAVVVVGRHLVVGRHVVIVVIIVVVALLLFLLRCRLRLAVSLLRFLRYSL